MLKMCLGLPRPDGKLMRTEKNLSGKFTMMPSTEADHYRGLGLGWVYRERKKKIK